MNRLAACGEIAGVFVASLLTLTIGLRLVGDGPLMHVVMIWIANLFMLAIVFAGLKLRGQTWDHFGLSFQTRGWRTWLRVLWQSLTVFVCAVAAYAVGAVIAANLVGIPEGADMSRYEYLQGNLPLTLAALASVLLISSFAEEVIYRGFLITRLMEFFTGASHSPWLAVLISSIVFGLIHSDWGLAGMIQTTCMGLALGVSYLMVRRNLWVTILAHAYMDTILVLQMFWGAA